MTDHTATIHGRTHIIPDICIMAMRQNGYTLHEIIEWWDAQELMAKEDERPEELTAYERAHLDKMKADAVEHMRQQGLLT